MLVVMLLEDSIGKLCDSFQDYFGALTCDFVKLYSGSSRVSGVWNDKSDRSDMILALTF
jgi:hypothetical protein